MELKSSVLATELAALDRAPQYNVSHTWDAVVHTPNGDVKALYVHWVKGYSNYTQNFQDELVVALSFPAGTFDFEVYPNRDSIELTLTKTITEVASVVMIKSLSAEIEPIRYRAKLVNPGSDTISQNRPGSQDKERLDATQTRDVKIQLIHRIGDYIRKMTSGGVFSNCRGADAVRVFLGKLSREAAVATGASFKGVDVAPGYNLKPSKVIAIKDNTPFPQIPKLINEESGGIYPTSFWYYLTGDFWFVYPKLDLERYFTHTGTRLRVINIPENKLPESPKTFMIKDRLITILATGDVKQLDLAEVEQETKGNGTRFTDPKNLFNDYVKRDKNKAHSDAKKAVSELSIKPRRDNTNFITASDIPITSRYNIELSKLAARSGMLVQFTWESALPELIYPGMPCSYIYLKNSTEIEELTGVVASVEWHSTTTAIDVKDRLFQRKAAVQMFVGRGIDATIVNHGNQGTGSATNQNGTATNYSEQNNGKQSADKDGINQQVKAFDIKSDFEAGKITKEQYDKKLEVLKVKL